MIMRNIVPRFATSEIVAAFERSSLMSWSASRIASAAIAEKYLDSPYPYQQRYNQRINQCCPELTFKLRYVPREKISYHYDARADETTVFDSSGYFIESNLENAMFCRCRNCAVCTKARIRKHRARLFQAFELMKDDYQDHQWIFLTLTTKQPRLTDTGEHLKLMNEAWSKLRQYKEFPGVGFVRSFEFTGPKQEGGGEWTDGPMHVHPHFHCLLMVKPSYFNQRSKAYVTQQRWRELWQRSLKSDYLPVVHVKKITPKPSKGTTSKEAAVLETVKYSVKPTTLAEAPSIWLSEITRQFHKTRSLTVGGVVAKYVSQAELDRIDDGEFVGDEMKQDGVTVTFRWDGEAYRSDDVVDLGRDTIMDCSEYAW